MTFCHLDFLSKGYWDYYFYVDLWLKLLDNRMIGIENENGKKYRLKFK